MRVQKTERRYQKPERGYIRQNHPLTKPPWIVSSRFYKTSLRTLLQSASENPLPKTPFLELRVLSYDPLSMHPTMKTISTPPPPILVKNMTPKYKSRFSGRGWGQQLFSFQSPAVQWMGRTSSLNCLSCRNPCQTPDSLNCLPPFHWKTLFSLKSASSHPLPKNLLWKYVIKIRGCMA